MNTNLGFKYFLLFVGITVPPIIIECYFRKRKRKLIPKYPADNFDYNFIFTSVKNRDCRLHVYKKTACSETCAYSHLKSIIEYIKGAKYSVCMCMHILCSLEIAETLDTLHQNNVHIRVITDREMANMQKSKADFLKSKGNSVCIY